MELIFQIVGTIFEIMELIFQILGTIAEIMELIFSDLRVHCRDHGANFPDHRDIAESWN